MSCLDRQFAVETDVVPFTFILDNILLVFCKSKASTDMTKLFFSGSRHTSNLKTTKYNTQGMHTKNLGNIQLHISMFHGEKKNVYQCSFH